MYDISKGESELSCLIPWLLNVQARAPSSPVVVIGTHIDKINKGGEGLLQRERERERRKIERERKRERERVMTPSLHEQTSTIFGGSK